VRTVKQVIYDIIILLAIIVVIIQVLAIGFGWLR